MVVNRETANYILEKTCRGFYYDKEIQRYQFKLMNVSEQLFNDMYSHMKDLGIRLTRDSLNSFSRELMETRKIEYEFSSLLQFKMLLAGEVIGFDYVRNGIKETVVLMKMSDNECWVIESSVRDDYKWTGYQVSPDIKLGNGCTINFNHTEIVLQRCFLWKPTNERRIVDACMFKNRNFASKRIPYSIWEARNELISYIQSPSSSFDNVIMKFCDMGLSTFTIRIMLDAYQMQHQ